MPDHGSGRKVRLPKAVEPALLQGLQEDRQGPISLGAKYVAQHVILQIELNVYSYFVLAIVTKIEVHR
jgi:hypothetical protein